MGEAGYLSEKRVLHVGLRNVIKDLGAVYGCENRMAGRGVRRLTGFSWSGLVGRAAVCLRDEG
jgi:hypothetical protein